VPTDSLIPQPCRIARRRRETPDTVTLWISASHPELCDVQPGQFNMLSIPGIGEVPISVSGMESASILMHTVRAVGSATRAIAALKRDAHVGVRGPFGRGWPLADASGRDVLMIGGGLGLAPLRLLWQLILRQREQFGRVNLLVGARSPGDLLYVRELKRLRSRLDLEVEVTVDHAGSGWFGHVGVVTHLIRRAEFDPDDATAFLCGPEIMMRYCVQELLHAGIEKQRLFLSMERNMHCAVGHCGHCQLGPKFICRDGPVFSYDMIGQWMGLAGI